jgi:hypothetical protein
LDYPVLDKLPHTSPQQNINISTTNHFQSFKFDAKMEDTLIDPLDRREREKEAIEAYNEDPFLTYRGAASAYGLTKSTLHNRNHQKHRPRADFLASQQLLTPVEEAFLERNILRADEAGFPLDYPWLRTVVTDILISKRVTTELGANWHYKFLNRHPEVKSAFARSMDRSRIKAQDPMSVRDWFIRFQMMLAKYGILIEDVWNFDESGSAIGVGIKNKVLVSVSRKEAFSAQDGNKEWASAIEAIRSTGQVLPPTFILAGVLQMAEWWNRLTDKDARIRTSPRGWSDDEIGFDWLQRFERLTREGRKGVWRMLIMDGHGSHLKLPFMEYATDHQILLACLPPHSTHILQPLDVAIFGPVKKVYDQEVKAHGLYNRTLVTKLNYLEWIQKVRTKVITPANIESAFRATGLIPYNPDRVLAKLPGAPTMESLGRPITPPDTQPTQSQPLSTPSVQVRNGSALIEVPIDPPAGLLSSIASLGGPSIGG